jgi:hypothetical protein
MPKKFKKMMKRYKKKKSMGWRNKDYNIPNKMAKELRYNDNVWDLCSNLPLRTVMSYY